MLLGLLPCWTTAALLAPMQHAARATVGRVRDPACVLNAVSDATFEDLVSDTEPMVIDLKAGYCGPCKMVVPALTRLAAGGISVFEADVEEGANSKLLRWLLTHGIRIHALPTLVLLRNGVPIRSMMGTDKILKQSSLLSFAYDETTPAHCTPAKPQKRVREKSGDGFFSRLGSRIGGFAF